MTFKRPRLSLALKFALSFGAVFIVTTFIFEGIVSETTEHYMEREMDARLQTKIGDLREVYELGGIDILQRLVEKRALQADSQTRIYLLTDHKFNKLSGNIDSWPEGVPKISGWAEVEEDHEDSNEYRYLALGIDDSYFLLLGLDTFKEEELEELVFMVFLGALILSLSGGGIAGYLLHKNLKERLELISETCSEIMLGRFSQRIPVSRTSDEIDVMAHTLNSMLDRIETLMDGIRHVTDNIAHDLRTPLTRLHGRLENLRGLTENDESRKFVEATIAEVDQLLITFAALLSISRLETGELDTNFKPIQLGPLVQDTIEIYEPIAEDKGQKILLEDQLNGKTVMGDRDLITQCISNLLDNAIKYGPENSRITIQLNEQDHYAHITIHDEGAGIPKAEQKKVLERFYRVESSRNLPGNGLGLALVSAVISIHNGELKLQNGDGFQVTISLAAG